MNRKQTASLPQTPGAIGIFDSGFGGLTVLKEIRSLLPQYDYLFLGDNARAPYGTRSFDVVYRYTLQGVTALFERGCHLVIIACNTASAKALRSIQQNDLPMLDANRRVLGVIRPTAEIIGSLTETRHIGLLATQGTVSSGSYEMEIKKLHPDITVVGQACPMWVPLVENFEYDKPGADYFVKEYIDKILERDSQIDLLLLGCTHFPFLISKIRQFSPSHVRIMPQGRYVAESLEDYLKRHPEMECRLTKGGSCNFLTTESCEKFDETAHFFLNENVRSTHLSLKREE